MAWTPSCMALVFLLTFGGTLPSMAFAAADGPVDGEARTSLAALSERSIPVARDKAYARERASRIRNLVCEALDPEVLARFVLGEYWPKISRGQREAFMDVFADTMVPHTLLVFGNYRGESFNVIAVIADRPKPKVIAIRVNVMRSKGAVLAKVDGQLREDWGDFKIIDIVGGGVSTALTLRKEYQAVIEKSEGRVDGLIEKLRKVAAWKGPGDASGAGCAPAALM